MKRLVLIGTAIAVLVGAGAAYATFNTYGGSGLAFSSKQAGSKKTPVGIGMVETLQANAPTGDRAAPLTDIKLTIAGAVINAAKFPKCTDSMIEANKVKYDAACPKGSRIGSGPVDALLGPGSNPSTAQGTSCDTVLHVYNGGPKTQVFFFTVPSPTSCGNLHTGSTAPYDGTISQHGKNVIVNVPLPSDISNQVAGIPGFYGSLIKEVLTFPRAEYKGTWYMERVACQGKADPWSIQYTAQDYAAAGATPTIETQTVTGKAPC